MLWGANKHLKNFILIVKCALDSLLLKLECEDYKPNEDLLLMGSALSRNSISIMQLFKDSISVEIFKSLLRFITDEIESVRISDLKLSIGCDVLLCELIHLSKKLKAVDLSNCHLTEEESHSIVQSLLNSSSTIESIKLSGNDVHVNNLCKLISMLETIKRVPVDVEIEIVGYTLKFRSRRDGCSSLTVRSILEKEETVGLEVFIESVKFPSNIQRIYFSHCTTILNAVSISQLIMKSPNLVETFVPQLQGSCHDTAMLAESLAKPDRTIQLQSVSNKSGFYFIISMKQLKLPANYSENMCICPNALQLITRLPQPQYLEFCNFSGQRKAFEDCPNCGSKGETAIQALCDLLAQSKNLKSIQLDDCYLKENQLQKLMYALKELPQVHELNVSGTSCNAESLAVLLTSNVKATKCLEFSLIITDKEIKYSCKTSTENSSILMDSFLKHLLRTNHQKELIIANAKLTEVQIKQLTQLTIPVLHICDCSLAMSHLLVMGRTFEVLTLSINALEHHFFEKLGQNSFLTILEISFINLKMDCSSEHLGEIFKKMLEENEYLKELTIIKCDIDAAVFCQLMKGLSKNKRLETLHISGDNNLIGNEHDTCVGQTIESMLKENNCLKVLGISYSNVHHSVLEHIAAGLTHNLTLNTLILDGLKVTTGYISYESFTPDVPEQPLISQDDWVNFFTILQKNKTLHTLSISVNRIYGEAFGTLKDFLQNNAAIIHLYVWKCSFSEDQLQALRTILKPKRHLEYNTPYPASLHCIKNSSHMLRMEDPDLFSF